MTIPVPLDERTYRLNQHIDDFLRDNPNLTWPTQHAMVQDLFLSLAGDDIQDFNARRCFVELVSVPTQDDVLEYTRVSTARRWAPAGGYMFHRKDSITGDVDATASYPAAAVRADYVQRKATLEANVRMFMAIGLQVIHDVGDDTELDNKERIDSILNIRFIFGIPTRDKFVFDEDGRITRIDFAASDEVLDESVIAAMGL